MRKKWRNILWCALGIAGIVSLFSSSLPDGLEKVAIEQGFNISGTSYISGIMSGYALPGMPHRLITTVGARILGVALVFVILTGFGRLLFRGKNTDLDTRSDVQGFDKPPIQMK